MASQNDDDDRVFAQAARKLLYRKEPSADRSHSQESSAAGAVGRHVRVKVTMNLDGDLLHFFKERAKSEGRPYQLLVNDALRDAMDVSRKSRVAREVGELLATDPEFLRTLKNQIKD